MLGLSFLAGGGAAPEGPSIVNLEGIYTAIKTLKQYKP